MPSLDRLTGGPGRRRRRMMRQLRALDRLDAGPGVRRPRARRPRGQRRGHNELVTALTVIVMGVLVVVFVPDLVPASVYRALGWAPPGVAAPAEAGPGSYKFSAVQRGGGNVPVAYDRCRPIHLVYNPDGAPEGGEQLTRTAMREVAKATGLRFVLDGRSERRPSLGGASRLVPADERTPVLVAFASADEVPRLKGRVAGVAGSVRVSDARGQSHYVTGQVVLDSEDFADILRRPAGRAQAQAIVLHEFGHLVGLDHVRDEDELMNAENVGRTSFGPGDLTGLAALGRGRCS